MPHILPHKGILKKKGKDEHEVRIDSSQGPYLRNVCYKTAMLSNITYWASRDAKNPAANIS